MEKIERIKKIEKLQYPVGDGAIWIIIYIELITFGLFFMGFAYTRMENRELFNNSQLLLDPKIGFINTLILLSSSYFVAKAVWLAKNSTQKEIEQKGGFSLLVAIFLGGFFLVLKLVEFIDKYQNGINLSTNSFFMFYFLLTMFHFMHIVLGLIILINLYNNTHLGLYTNKEHKGLQTGASYWHMVDLLWIVLFPLVYIIR